MHTHNETEVCQPVSDPFAMLPGHHLLSLLYSVVTPKAPVRLLTPQWHAAPMPARDLVSIDFDDFPFQGRLGKDPEISPTPPAHSCCTVV